MRTRELKRIILQMFGDREFYGYNVHKKISAMNIKIEISRLYRVLNEMLREGLLEGRWEKSHLGPRKRVYKLGRKGKKELDEVLLDAIKTVHTFYGKYLLALPADTNPMVSLCRVLVGDLKKGNLAFLAKEFSHMNELAIRQIHDLAPDITKYIVKTPTMQIDFKLNNHVLLDGSYEEIPLRNRYLDLMIVIGLPTMDYLEGMLTEFHRVMKLDGRLVIVSPTVQTETYKDPLTIGDFLEKHEHEEIEKGEHIEKEYLVKLLAAHFKKIEESRIVHLSVFSASELNHIPS